MYLPLISQPRRSLGRRAGVSTGDASGGAEGTTGGSGEGEGGESGGGKGGLPASGHSVGTNSSNGISKVLQLMENQAKFPFRRARP